MLRKNPTSETLASVACPKLSATERRDVEDLIHALLDLEVWGLKEGLQNTSTKPDTDYTLERLHFGVLQTQTDPIDKSLRDHNQEPPESLHNSLQPASIAVTPPIQSRFETLNLTSKRSIRQRPSQIARCCMLAELGCLPQGS